MNAVKGLLGIKSGSQKRAEAAAAEQTKVATEAQQRASRAAEEDAAVNAQRESALSRLARSAGRRVLAFQGVETGLIGRVLGG